MVKLRLSWAENQPGYHNVFDIYHKTQQSNYELFLAMHLV